jgi:Tol biopolymer transport system component/predicted Ser/Thr protein kinase
MALAHGRRLGPYEILELLGSGGMGEVYRGRDTRLDRVVAVKVLGGAAREPSRARDRFEREARAISSLSHPHICAVYDVGREDGIDYIVMEYLQGESLASRLGRRALRLDQALQHGVEIASALAEAHRAGIVHRDLKPANVMLTQAGAKLLDFGLAKLREPEDPSLGTTADPLTAEGALLGTLPYMSPEQVEGKEADARSDIFSFGAMLHEMLTHERAFVGSQAHLIAAILSSEPPPPSTLRALCPPEVDHVVARCLAKDPDQRWQTSRDLLLELKWAAARLPAVPGRGARSLRPLAWAAGAALGTALTIAAFLRLTGEEPLPTASPRQVTMAPGWESAPALSPDGGLIAYASDESGSPDVWIVDVKGGNAIRLTDDPASDTDPAWLPDGSALAFTSDRGGGAKAIWKVLRFGGAPTLLVPDAEDAAIAPDGSQIAFAREGATGNARVWVAPMTDLARARVLTGDSDGFWDHREPAFSPDGRTICYHAQRDLWLVYLDGRPARRLTVDDESDIEPAWSADGRYVYFSSFRGGAWAVWRVPAEGGAPRRVTQGTGAERHPSVSRDGKRLALSTLSAKPDLMLLDLSSRKEARLRGLDPGSGGPAWAPDGRSFVFNSARIGGRFDLWIQPVLDLAASGPPRRLTDQPGSASSPAFSPDGRWVAYYRILAGQRDIWIVPAAGGNPVQFTDHKAADVHPAWSPDGTQLAFRSEQGEMARIWVAPVADGRPAGAARPITTGSSADQAPAWSPDGKWIAYIGATSGRSANVWVVDASGAGSPRMLATEGRASRVGWDPTGKALFVSGQWEPGASLRKYGLDTGRRILLDPPVRLGQNPDLFDFSLSRDGRFVAFRRDELRGDIWALESLDRRY